jgi:archaellum biogenesis ATPase FlaH
MSTATIPETRSLLDDLELIERGIVRDALARRKSLSSGFPEFDRVLGGLPKFMVLGGAPGVGKSAFALQIACQMAERGGAFVLYQSAEMPRADIYRRICARQGGSASNSREWIEKHGRFLAIEQSFALTRPDDLAAQLERLQLAAGACRSVIVIDSLQELAARFSAGTHSPKDAIDSNLRLIRELVDGSTALALLVSHYTKSGVEASRDFPFSGSSGISYLPDVTATLTRNGSRSCRLDFPKCRHSKASPISFTFDGARMTFTEKAGGRK